jgi:pimeloyl-ACP methyl ester carboxylesterase
MSSDYDPSVSVAGFGPTIVLVPGMDGTGKLFYRQVPLLARAYRVVTYALRDTAATMDTLVADLARIIETVAPERRAIVVGESFGGAIALSFALTRPEQVSGLVVLNSFPHFAPQWRLWLAVAALTHLPSGTMRMVRRLTAFRLHSAHTHRDEIRTFMALTAQATREGYVNRLTLLTRYDVRDRLRELRVPTLYLAADRDHLVPSVPQAEFMAARTRRSSLRVLAGHGHICLIAPDIDLGRELQDWVRNSDGGPDGLAVPELHPIQPGV